MPKSAEITIRPLKASDLPEWRRLWTGYLTFYETTVSERVYETTFARLLSDEPHEFSCRLAVDADGQPVGLVHFLFHRHNWKVENVCYLQDLFTAPEARNMGVARKLIEQVYAEADAAGCPAVYWLTQEFNHTARALYDKIAQKTPFIRYQRG